MLDDRTSHGARTEGRSDPRVEAAWAPIEAHFGIETVEAAVARARRAGELIGQDAGMSMPMVSVEPVGWDTLPVGVVFAGCDVWRFPDGTFEWIARMPIATAILADDDTVRGLLVHEYRHCFWHIEQTLAARQNGRCQLGGLDFADLNDARLFLALRAIDSLTLARPGDWFGLQDATRVEREDDVRLAELTVRYQQVWVGHGLPRCAPPRGKPMKGMARIPKDIAERAMGVIRRWQY